MVTIKNPITIVNQGGGGGSEPGGNIKITAYDTSTGVISGGGFGSTPGYVYVLDRDTNTYVAQTVASWTPSSITLDTPVDLTTLEGTTSMAVVADDGTWSNKWLLTGDVAVSGWGKLYVQNPDTRAIYTVAVTSQAMFSGLCGDSANTWSRKIYAAYNFYADEVVGFQFGSDFNLTAIGDYFLAYFVNLMQPIVVPNTVTSIEDYFMNSVSNFDQPVVVPSTVTSIGTYFLSNSSFNQPFQIPSSLALIDNYFFYQNCRFNQPLTIPSSVTSIGTSFLISCYSFNQPLTIPSGITSIGNGFLSSCYSFNQPLTIPSGITSIGNSFLFSCSSFNQPLTIPSGITSIGNSFMSMCRSFNYSLTIPSSVTTVGISFMERCDAFSDLTVNTSAHPLNDSTGYSLSPRTSNTTKMYVKGITVKGTGRSAWISALPNRTSSPYRKLIDGGE